MDRRDGAGLPADQGCLGVDPAGPDDDLDRADRHRLWVGRWGRELYFSGYFRPPTHSSGGLALAGLIALYPMTLLSVIFNVALGGAAAASLEGRSIGVRQALEISWTRLGRIAQWALLAAGVGFILEQLASRIPGAGRLASWLIGAAWSLATIFAVPLLALEGPGSVETAKQSVGLIKGKWGEGITGLVSIGVWTIVAVVPIGIIFGVGLGIRHRDANLGAALISIAVGGFLLVEALSLATREVFAVAFTATPTAHLAPARSPSQTLRNRSAAAATATDPRAGPLGMTGLPIPTV
ncbi:MAG TPA: DUF6159 family protein [Solirubrobacterales bacterium]|jgi:hypothetical protein